MKEAFAPKPCPFCGNDPRVIKHRGKGRGPLGASYYRERVACKCGVSGSWHKAPGSAVRLWNKRANLGVPA